MVELQIKKHVYLKKGFILSILSICLLFSYSNLISTSITVIDRKLSNNHLTEGYQDEIPYGISLIGADKVWNRTKGLSDIVVAVLDSGVDPNHSDLKESIWNNTDEIAENGIDDDQNGYIDDLHGWDFINNVHDPFLLPTSVSNPLRNHGTHVAGTIGARLNNFGVVGVAPNITIMSLRVVNNTNYNPDIYVAKAIKYAVENGAQIISMSIAITDDEITNSTSYQLVEEALEFAYSEGVLIVASAGNSGSAVTRPANNEYVIAVGAIDSNKNLASFSSRGLDLEVVAPGVGVKSTIPNNEFMAIQGTSMAAPHVSGALALILSYSAAFSEKILNNTEARTLLQETAEDLGEPYRDSLFGFGLINVSRAIEAINDPNLISSSTSTKTKSLDDSSILLIFLIAVPTILIKKRLGHSR